MHMHYQYAFFTLNGALFYFKFTKHCQIYCMWFMQKAGYGFDLLLDTILLGLLHKFSITIF